MVVPSSLVQLARSRRASRRAAWRRGSTAARRTGRAVGSRTMARPMATRWRCPPESCAWLAVEQSARCCSDARRLVHPRLISCLGRTSAIFSPKAMFSARSCAGRARSTGTPSRRRARAGATVGDDRGRRSRSSPSVDLLEAGDHPQQRRLAAARGPDEHDEFALLRFEAHPVNDGDGAETLDYLVEFQERHGVRQLLRM